MSSATLCFWAATWTLAVAVAVAVAAANTTPSSAPSVSKPVVTIYYENLCPDSVKFFTENLYKTYSTSNLNDSATLKLNPYGNTNFTTAANGSVSFTCEHGATECHLNVIHACVIRNEANVAAVLHFVNCSLYEAYHNTSENPTKKCAKSAGINSTAIDECTNSTTSNQYYYDFGLDLKKAGIDVIPSVVFNNTYNKTLSAEAVVNFSDAFCSYVKTNNFSNEYCKAKENNSASVPSLSLLTLVVATVLLVRMHN